MEENSMAQETSASNTRPREDVLGGNFDTAHSIVDHSSQFDENFPLHLIDDALDFDQVGPSFTGNLSDTAWLFPFLGNHEPYG